MRLATERCATIKSHSANFRSPDILEGRRTGLWLETANPSTRQYPREAQQECGLRGGSTNPSLFELLHMIGGQVFPTYSLCRLTAYSVGARPGTRAVPIPMGRKADGLLLQRESLAPDQPILKIYKLPAICCLDPDLAPLM